MKRTLTTEEVELIRTALLNQRGRIPSYTDEGLARRKRSMLGDLAAELRTASAVEVTS